MSAARFQERVSCEALAGRSVRCPGTFAKNVLVKCCSPIPKGGAFLSKIRLGGGQPWPPAIPLAGRMAPNPTDEHVGARPHPPAGAEIRERRHPHLGKPVA